jgi:transcription factor C subunit 6
MAGLENLSDGESRSDNEAEGSGSGQRGQQPAGSDSEGANDSDSISSGASSEFQMQVDDDGKKGKRKGKGKGTTKGKQTGKGKGKAARQAREGSGSAFEDDEGGSSEDISMDEESDDMPQPIEDDEGVEPVPPPRGQRGRGTGRGRGRGRGGRAHKQPQFSTLPTPALPLYAYASASGSTASSGNPHILPEAYRKIIGASAEVLTKNTQGAKKVVASQEKDYDKYRRFGVEGLAFGPPTPFVTRLTGPARDAGTEVRWTWESEDPEARKDARREKLWNVEGAVPLAMPSEIWTGEGWWKGMYDAGEVVDGQGGPAGNKGKDAGRKKGWKLREDVRLGLEGVGRSSSPSLRTLSREYV